MPREEFCVLPPLEPGDIVRRGRCRPDSFRIVGATVNRGGFGRIYRAVREFPTEDSGIRKYAIKEFCVNEIARYGHSFVPMSECTHNQMQKKLSSLRSRFFIETKMLCVIRSGFRRQECIPKIFGLPFDTIDGRLMYVMEYIEGPTLTEEVRNWGPMPENVAIPLICQVAEVLEQTHKHSIVHGDVSPNNIILRNEETPVLVDYGNARSYYDEGFLASMEEQTREMYLPYQRALDDSMRQTGVTDEDLDEINRRIISPGFSAPDWYRGRVEGDVYSTAMTLYYLLTAELPHVDDPERMLRTLRKRKVSDYVTNVILDNVEVRQWGGCWTIPHLMSQLR